MSVTIPNTVVFEVRRICPYKKRVYLCFRHAVQAVLAGEDVEPRIEEREDTPLCDDREKGPCSR